MSFEVEGVLYKKFDTEKKTETFSAREFVIEVTESKYPQYIKFQLTQERCSKIDNFQVGEQLKVFFNLRGREWQDKFFTNLEAWLVQPVNDESKAPNEDPIETDTQNESTVTETSMEESNDDYPLDDLPF